MAPQTWRNTVVEIEVPEVAHDAFFDGLMDHFQMVSSTAINEVLRAVRLTIPEEAMEHDEIWRVVAHVANEYATDGLDLIVARFYTEHCWSREP